MALYNIVVEKQFDPAPEMRWSNVYHLNASDIDAAADRAQEIADIEAAILWDNVHIVRLGVKGATGPGTGTSAAVFIQGLRADADPNVQLPLFNTVLVKLIPPIGRASMKYLRLPLVEAEVTGFALDPTFTSFVSTEYTVPLLALGYVTDEDGQTFAGYGFNPLVQMRQLGWHRRTRPGYHRGWVPD